jgi:hypothetical protein
MHKQAIVNKGSNAALSLLHKSRQATLVRAHCISWAHPISKLIKQIPKLLSN